MSFRTFVNSISIWPDQNSLYFPFSASFSFLCTSTKGTAIQIKARQIRSSRLKPNHKMLKYCTCRLPMKPQQKPKSFTHILNSELREKKEQKNTQKNQKWAKTPCQLVKWLFLFFFSRKSIDFRLFVECSKCAHLFVTDYFVGLLQ